MTLNTGRTTEDEESFYVCGQCGLEQYYLKSDEPPVPCIDCGWEHKAMKKFDLPDKIRLSLNQY